MRTCALRPKTVGPRRAAGLRCDAKTTSPHEKLNRSDPAVCQCQLSNALHYSSRLEIRTRWPSLEGMNRNLAQSRNTARINHLPAETHLSFSRGSSLLTSLLWQCGDRFRTLNILQEMGRFWILEGLGKFRGSLTFLLFLSKTPDPVPSKSGNFPLPPE